MLVYLENGKTGENSVSELNFALNWQSAAQNFEKLKVTFGDRKNTSF
jgi:hypothetical protein